MTSYSKGCCTAVKPRSKNSIENWLPPPSVINLVMVARDNLYDLLGVDFAASDADIRRRFKKLSHQFHPDGLSRRARQPEEAGHDEFENSKWFVNKYFQSILGERKLKNLTGHELLYLIFTDYIIILNNYKSDINIGLIFFVF